MRFGRAFGVGGGLAVVLTSACLQGAPPVGAALAPRAVPPAVVQIRSSFETVTRSVSRDIGISVALPDGHAIWIFGDTGIWKRSGTNWTETKFMPGSSALQVNYKRGEVPHGGEYPTGAPSRFVPAPTNVYMPDGTGRKCQYPTAAFAARWPNGAAIVPTNDSQILITYTAVCVTRGHGIPVARTEGWGYELYNWREHRIVRVHEVFSPKRNGAALGASLAFGWPIFSDGKLTLFSAKCTSLYIRCTDGHVWSVTLPATFSALDHLGSYPVVALSTDGTSPWEPLGISVGLFPGGLRLLETTSIGGTYKIFSASSPAGPWSLLRSGSLPGCPTKRLFCFALEGHPELSTASQLFVSYKHPDSGPPVGHIVVSAIPD